MKRWSLLFYILSFISGSIAAQNPYLPLWEHLPDGEPRVFEDPISPASSVPISLVRTM